jgi:hypothetical protein
MVSSLSSWASDSSSHTPKVASLCITPSARTVNASATVTASVCSNTLTSIGTRSAGIGSRPSGRGSSKKLRSSVMVNGLLW